jgi:hypothetical protein
MLARLFATSKLLLFLTDTSASTFLHTFAQRTSVHVMCLTP